MYSNSEHTFQQPTQVIADFEEAPAAALRNVYGDQFIVSGCWFHYSQALIKRLRKLGLTDGYRNDEETQTIFRCLLSLPLLHCTRASGTEELSDISVGHLGNYNATTEICGETVGQ